MWLDLVWFDLLCLFRCELNSFDYDVELDLMRFNLMWFDGVCVWCGFGVCFVFGLVWVELIWFGLVWFDVELIWCELMLVRADCDADLMWVDWTWLGDDVDLDWFDLNWFGIGLCWFHVIWFGLSLLWFGLKWVDLVWL